jgi:hypothetical protein
VRISYLRRGKLMGSPSLEHIHKPEKAAPDFGTWPGDKKRTSQDNLSGTRRWQQSRISRGGSVGLTCTAPNKHPRSIIASNIVYRRPGFFHGGRASGARSCASARGPAPAQAILLGAPAGGGHFHHPGARRAASRIGIGHQRRLAEVGMVRPDDDYVSRGHALCWADSPFFSRRQATARPEVAKGKV